MLATEKHQANFIAPIGIGLSLFIAELMGVYYTGGSVNPARSFGPCVVDRSFYTYHWIYWVGPVLGGMLAAAFYMFIKSLEYETVNLEVDPNEVVGKKFDPQSRREKLVTRDGGEVDALPSNADRARLPVAHGAHSDERTVGRNSDLYARGPDLENGQKASAPMP